MPRAISTLDLGSIHDPDGFGMGHMPLSYSAYLAWEPTFLMAQGLDEDELRATATGKKRKAGISEELSIEL